MDIYANPLPTDPSSMQVNWSETPGEVYDSVSIDEYQASQLPKSGPLPAPEQSQTGLAALGGTTEFHGLKSGTGYVFVIYGHRNYGDGTTKTLLTNTPVVSTAAPSQPPPADDGLHPPICTATPHPRDLYRSNRIEVSWTSATRYDNFAVTCNYSADPPTGSRVELDTGGTSGSYTFDGLRPGNTYAFSAQGGQDYVGGLLAGALGHKWSAYGPLVQLRAVPNSTSLATFLANSGVAAAGGLRPLLPGRDGFSLGDLMGIR